MPFQHKPKVYFFFQHNGSILKNRTKLKSFIEGLFRKEKKGLDEICYIFCSDKQLLAINKKFLDKSYYTDIITFDLSNKMDFIKAESYISIEKVRDNARILGVPISAELHRVIFHGALHLCGYNDKTKSEVLLMRKKEDYYLSLFRKSV